MQASIGVSAGPVRLSQGLPGLGAIVAALPAIGVLVVVGWVSGLASDPLTEMAEDGHYIAGLSAPEGSKIKAGTYVATAPKKPKGTFTDDDRCNWQVMDGSGNEITDGKAKPGKKATVHVASGQHVYTFNCGVWTKQS